MACDQGCLRLSARLHAVAEFVPQGARVADIGTDHGRLLVEVLTRRRAQRVIGIDCRTDPLRVARSTIDAAGAEIAARVELRLGDGLAALAPGEVDAIVIAGMGARRICTIVDAHRDRVSAAVTLILQPANDWQHLRSWLAGAQMRPLGERIVWERGRAHLVLAVTPGSWLWEPDDISFGPRLRREPDESYRAWLDVEQKRMQAIVARPGAAGPTARVWCERVAAEWTRVREGVPA